jgi:glycosyltransferase involved in cell wall biosynthesis
MRVLFVNRYAGAYGGVEVYVRRTAAALAERGIHCALGFVERRGDSAADYLAAFPECFQAEDEAAIAREAERRQFDAVFLHKVDRVSPFLRLPPGIKLLRYVHDHDLVCPRRHKYYASNSAICDRAAGAFCFLDAGFIERRGRFFGFKSPLRFFSEMADNRRIPEILVGSAWMREEMLANCFDPERVFVLPPVPPESPELSAPPPDGAKLPGQAAGKASAGSPGATGTGTGTRYILYVGQLIRGKGVDLLLRAFALLAPDYPELELSVAGAGNALDSLRSLVRELNLDSRVRFEGSIPSAKLDDLYRGAECLVVPSRWPEPFGMIGLEAMRKSIPVVGFASGGIPDWLRDGENGILVPCADIPALAKAIRRLLDDRQLAKAMGETGRRMAMADFSFRASIETLVGHLSPAVSRPFIPDPVSGGTE